MRIKTIAQHKGLNRFASALNMSPDWLWTIQNGFIDKENNIQQRSGIAKFNTDAITGTPSILYMKEVQFPNGNTYMICRAGTAWWKEDGDAVWDSLDGSRTNGAQGQAVVFNNLLIMVDGGAPRKCDLSGNSFGTPAGLGGTCPTDATAVHVHNGHVIMNDPGTMDVYISALNNAENYTTANDALTLAMKYVFPTSDTIVGFASLGEDLLLIMGKQYIAVYSAPADTVNWSLQGTVIPTGAITRLASLTHPQSGALFVPGIESINLFTGAGNYPQDPILAVAPYYRTLISQATSTNWTYINGCFNRTLNHYYVSIPNATTPIILVYSFDLQGIVGWFVGYTAWSMAERQNGTVIIGGASGRAYTMNSGTSDDGTAITFVITTPYYYLDSPENYKVCRRLESVFEHTAAFTLLTDYSWDTQGAMTQTSKSIAAPGTIGRTTNREEGIKGRGRSLQVQLTNATKDTIINIPSWSLGYIVEGTK